MLSAEFIKQHLEAFLQKRNLFLLDIHISPQNQIEITIDGDNYVSINDCTEVSRFVESILNREEEDFSLLISSPDAHKPLIIPRQYPKHTGKNIQILTIDNKEYKGILMAADAHEIILLIQTKNKENKKKTKQEIKIPFNAIKKAKILLPFWTL